MVRGQNLRSQRRIVSSISRGLPFVSASPAREKSAPIQFLKGKAHLNIKAKGRRSNPIPVLDAFRLQYPNRRNAVTFHGFRRFLFRFRLDYIFVPSSIKVQDAKIIQLRWKKCYPSDHFPILTRIDIPPSLADPNSGCRPGETVPKVGAIRDIQ